MNTIKLNTIGERPIKKVASGGGGGNYVYFDTSSITEFDDRTYTLYGYTYLIKEHHPWDGNTMVIPTWWRYDDHVPIAVCIDLNLKINDWDEEGENVLSEMITFGEYIAKHDPWILDLPRLTEEEFYNINSNESPE